MSEPTIDFANKPATEQQAPNLPGIQSAYLGPASSASASATGGGGGGGLILTTSFPGSPTDGEAFMLTDNTALPTWYQQFQYNATAGIWLGVGPARGTSFPAAPVEGMQAILTDSLASPTWNWLCWYSTAAAKWLFLGGPGAYSSVDTLENVSSAVNTFADFPTVGPSFTVPRAGVYTVRFGATGGGNGAASTSYCGALVGATTPSETDRTSVSAGNNTTTGGHEQFTTGSLTVSTVIKLQGADGDVTRRIAFGKRWLSVTPVTMT